MTMEADLARPLSVVDTNVFLSAFVSPHGNTARRFEAIFNLTEVLYSEATLRELSSKLSSEWIREKRSAADRSTFFTLCRRSMTGVGVQPSVDLSRDKSDNMFLDLAVTARADMVISGDNDLLIIKEVRGIGHIIPVVRPADFESFLPRGQKAPQFEKKLLPEFFQLLRERENR